MGLGRAFYTSARHCSNYSFHCDSGILNYFGLFPKCDSGTINPHLNNFFFKNLNFVQDAVEMHLSRSFRFFCSFVSSSLASIIASVLMQSDQTQQESHPDIDWTYLSLKILGMAFSIENHISALGKHSIKRILLHKKLHRDAFYYYVCSIHLSNEGMTMYMMCN